MLAAEAGRVAVAARRAAGTAQRTMAVGRRGITASLLPERSSCPGRANPWARSPRDGAAVQTWRKRRGGVPASRGARPLAAVRSFQTGGILRRAARMVKVESRVLKIVP